LKGTKDKGLTFHQGKDAQRHDQNGDHQIGDGQRHEEVVGHILQPALPGDGQADQDVPGRRSQDEDEGQQGPVVVGIEGHVLGGGGEGDIPGDIPPGHQQLIMPTAGICTRLLLLLLLLLLPEDQVLRAGPILATAVVVGT